MAKYNTHYQAYRRDKLHRYANMDPDVLVAELEVDTLDLMNALAFKIERTIEQDYEEEYGPEEQEEEILF